MLSEPLWIVKFRSRAEIEQFHGFAVYAAAGLYSPHEPI